MTMPGNTNNKLKNDEQNSFIEFQNIYVRSLLENTDAAKWAIDKEYALVIGNSAFKKNYRETFGYEIKEGKSVIPAALPESYRKEWKSYYDRALNGEHFFFEREQKFSNNTQWKYYNVGPVKSEDGDCIGVSVEARDITERKRIQHELLGDKQYFEELIEFLPGAFFEFDAKLNLTYANEQIIRMFGYSRKDLSSTLNALDMIIPEQRDLARSYFAKRIKGEEPGPIEYQALKKDGSSFPVLFQANSIFEEGKLISARGLIINISEYKKAEEKQKKMAMILDVAPNSITIHDFEGNFLYANQKTFELHGYSREEFMALNLRQLDSPKSSKYIPGRLKMILEKGEANFMVEHQKKDGTVLPLEIYTLLTKWGSQNAVLSIGTDITMRRRNEKALIESERKFKNIFNNSLIGISVTDLDGGLKVNKAFSRIVGYSEDELNNSNWKEITHPEDVDKNQKVLESILIGRNRTARWEKRYIHKNGNIVWVDISTTLQRDNKGNPQYFITSISDITERKRAEEKLLSSQQILEGIFNTIPVRIFWKDKNLNYLGCNQAFADDTGFSTPKEIIGKNDFQLEWSELAEMYRKDDLQVISSGTPKLNIEEPLTNAQGKRITLLANKIPLRNSENEISGVLGTYMDITERKSSENELLLAKEKVEDSEKKFRGIYNSLPVGIFRSTPSGKILSVNPSFLKMYGYNNIQEVENTDAKDFYTKKSDREEILRELKEKGVIKDFVTKEKKKDGTEIWVESNYSVVKNEKGEIEYIDGILEDISARVEAENKVAEYKKRLQISLEATHATVFEDNLKTGEMICTPEMFHHFGYSTDRIPTTIEEFSKLIHPDDISRVFEALKYHVEGKSPEYYVEFRIKDAKGNWRWIDGKGNIASKDKNGTPLTMIGISRDISEQKEVELELIKAKEKAEESERLKSAFLANMSHEIRTPMNGILGFADLLKEPQLTGEQQQKYIQIIEKSGARMLNTINNIIDISKIEAGQMQISISDIYIPEQFDNIISFFKPEADKKGIQLIIKNRLGEKDLIFHSDKEKLFAILTNLVKNALKYCYDGNIELGFQKKDNMYEFYVKDTGKGIPKERQHAVFERFIQADILDREALQGSGLGLAISKSYVEMLGGKIWLVSKEGSGSTFYFTIPVNPKLKDMNNSNNDAMADKTKNQTKRIKVLIAEDDPVSIMLIKIMIDKVSSEILFAKTGTETVNLCRRHPDIDLILMDIKMPGINGNEAAKKIREFNQNVIIIAQTAFALAGDRENAINAGCNDYISKPINQIQLNELIEKYFG